MNPPATARDPSGALLYALQQVLSSLGALRNGRALYALLASFATAGLLLAMAEGALARGAQAWGAGYVLMALLSAFYGVTTAGLMLMDQALGRPVRELADAVRDALGLGHRLLVVLLAGAALPAAAVLGAAGLFWLARADVLGGTAGAVLFGLAVPAAVVLVGATLLALVGLVAPLAGPAIWFGLSVRQSLAWLAQQVRRRLVLAALLMGAVALLTTAVAALTAFVVVGGGRVVALLAVLVGGVEVAPQQLMAGLFGYGLRSMGASGAPAAQSAHGAAALVGGGVVFALALVTPALVYLRGTCAAFLVLRRAAADIGSD